MDWSNPAGSMVSGAMGLIGSALQYKYNSKLQEKQNQFNLDMWNLQNEYNSPQAQMKRFEEAGLNPALIYSQGNPGNATSAPVQGVPEAPEISRDMKELGQAFNIEGLKTAIANRKKAQADAKDATINADRNEMELEAERNMGLKYTLDPQTGVFVERPLDSYGQRSVVHRSAYYLNRLLADNFRTNRLLVPRASLIGSQQSLNSARGRLIAPQIRMANFNAEPWRMKTNFWLGNVKTGVQAIGGLVPYLPF